MKGDMLALRLPNVINGKTDALEHFMGDYLVGMFDDAAPLLIAPVSTVQCSEVFKWRGMSVVLFQAPPGGVLDEADAVDVIDLDMLAPVARTIEGAPVDPGHGVGERAVRVAAWQRCVREAGPMGAAWLQFRGAV
jgi:hypothetical protein